MPYVLVCVIPPNVTDLRRIYFRDLLVREENTDSKKVTYFSRSPQCDFTHHDLRLKYESYITIIIITIVVYARRLVMMRCACRAR